MTPPDVGIALSPYHLYQIVGLRDEARPIRVIGRHSAAWSPVFASIPGLTLVPAEARDDEVRRASRDSALPFDAWHAMPWNATALRLERAARRSGGNTYIVEDGIGNYRPPPGRPRSWRDRALGIALGLRHGIRVADHPLEVAYDLARTRLWSLAADLSPDPRVEQADIAQVRRRLEPLLAHFGDLAALRGRPAFFDTDECENGCIAFPRKVAILRDLLPREPVLWFPHPNQRHHLPSALPNLVDMAGRTHALNDLACWAIQPSAVYSVFSSAAFVLRRLFGLEFHNVLFAPVFLERTGQAAYALSPEMRRVLA